MLLFVHDGEFAWQVGTSALLEHTWYRAALRAWPVGSSRAGLRHCSFQGRAVQVPGNSCVTSLSQGPGSAQALSQGVQWWGLTFAGQGTRGSSPDISVGRKSVTRSFLNEDGGPDHTQLSLVGMPPNSEALWPWDGFKPKKHQVRKTDKHRDHGQTAQCFTSLPSCLGICSSISTRKVSDPLISH